jgi:hypothetical protein
MTERALDRRLQWSQCQSITGRQRRRQRATFGPRTEVAGSEHDG